MFTIEKATTAPPSPIRHKWPFAQMSVGDVVKITADKPTRYKAQVYTGVVARQKGMKFTTKTIDDVLHVWRVK